MVSRILAWIFLIIITAVSLAVIMAVAGLSWGIAFMKFSHPRSISALQEPYTSISNWQTYRNEELGFEFRYPGDWVLDLSSYSLNSNDVPFPSIKITHPQRNDSATDLERMMLYPKGFIADYSSTRQYETVISGKSVQVLEFLQSKPVSVFQRVYRFYDLGGFQIVLIRLSLDNIVGKDSLETLEKILGTFRFIESPYGSKWQIYKDEYDGFIVRYPSDWIVERQIGTLFSSPAMRSTPGKEGFYSLTLHIHSDFETMDDFIKSRKNCVENISYLDFENFAEARYQDTCYFESPQVFVRPYQQKIIEGISYSSPDEYDTIHQILSTFKFKE